MPAGGGTTCSCYRSSTAGYWDGVFCDTCLTGYGPAGYCTEQQSDFSRLPNIQPTDLYNTSDVSLAAVLVDPQPPARPMYAGGRPLVITALLGPYRLGSGCDG